MIILISPFSRQMRNGKRNPKNYAFWPELIEKILELGHEIIQIGRVGEDKLVPDCRFGLALYEVTALVLSCDLWISVDNFLPHLANHTSKPGIVLFGRSDPNIYGYDQNINIIKDRKYLREKQFDIWEVIDYSEDVFVTPNFVIDKILNLKEIQ